MRSALCAGAVLLATVLFPAAAAANTDRLLPRPEAASLSGVALPPVFDVVYYVGPSSFQLGCDPFVLCGGGTGAYWRWDLPAGTLVHVLVDDFANNYAAVSYKFWSDTASSPLGFLCGGQGDLTLPLWAEAVVLYVATPGSPFWQETFQACGPGQMPAAGTMTVTVVA